MVVARRLQLRGQRRIFTGFPIQPQKRHLDADVNAPCARQLSSRPSTFHIAMSQSPCHWRT